jgi:hypothetical protein
VSDPTPPRSQRATKTFAASQSGGTALQPSSVPLARGYAIRDPCPVGSRSHPIRFTDDVWNAIRLAADHQGISAAEFVRIGALSYAAYCVGRRGDEVTGAFDELFDSARRLLEVWPL